MRGRRASRFANADGGSPDEHLDEIGCNSAKGRHGAPQCQRNGDDPHPATAVRRARDRETEDRVEYGECGSTNQAELKIAEMEIDLDHFLGDREEQSINIVEAVEQKQRDNRPR
jgi:hypothetical protein